MIHEVTQNPNVNRDFLLQDMAGKIRCIRLKRQCTAVSTWNDVLHKEDTFVESVLVAILQRVQEIVYDRGFSILP